METYVHDVLSVDVLKTLWVFYKPSFDFVSFLFSIQNAHLGLSGI